MEHFLNSCLGMKYSGGMRAIQTVLAVKNLVSRRPLSARTKSRVAYLLLLPIAVLATGCSGGFTGTTPQNGFVNPGSFATPTPRPTATATPSPTATPYPTATPNSTATPLPTATPTPHPTATPVPTPVPTPTYAQCLEETAQRFEAQTYTQSLWYLIHGGKAPLAADQPFFRKGTNGKAVVLVHGYVSSPSSMRDLGDELVNEGYTVIAPVMTGYGATAKAANTSGPDEWRGAVQDAVDLMKLCHQDISAIAHSLGGGITTDLIANRGVTGISKLVLLAPFFKIGNPYIQDVLDVAGPFTDTIYLSDLEDLMPVDPYEVVGWERPKPGEPEPFLPLTAAQKVLDLHKVFAASATWGQLSQPKVLLAITQADEVIKNSWAEYYVGMRFSRTELFSYPAAEKIPHSFNVKSNNPRFRDLTSRISTFLSTN